MSVYDHDARVQIKMDMNAILKEVARFTDEGIEAVAKEAAARAKATTDFIDKMGTLRKSIKAQKSKKNKNEYSTSWIVKAGAPHAHLVAYGHAQVTKSGDVVKHVPGEDFLQNAVDSVMPEAERIAAEHLKKLNIKV